MLCRPRESIWPGPCEKLWGVLREHGVDGRLLLAVKSLWGMASSAACECGVEEQTIDHVVLQCPIHRPPHRLHGLAVLDDETTKWLLNTCPEI